MVEIWICLISDAAVTTTRALERMRYYPSSEERTPFRSYSSLPTSILLFEYTFLAYQRTFHTLRVSIFTLGRRILGKLDGCNSPVVVKCYIFFEVCPYWVGFIAFLQWCTLNEGHSSVRCVCIRLFRDRQRLFFMLAILQVNQLKYLHPLHITTSKVVDFSVQHIIFRVHSKLSGWVNIILRFW